MNELVSTTRVPVRPRHRAITTVVAVATAFSSANLYYLQPLLPTVALDLAITEAAAGTLLTAAQLGFIAGVVLILPLGDALDRGRLVPVLLAVAAAGQLLATTVDALPWLLAASVLIGIGSCAAQILVPFAGQLAAPELRARAVGRAVAALLTGILLARAVSGLVSEAAGWRAVYLLSAGVLIVLAMVIRLLDPEADISRTASTRVAYGALLSSVARAARSEPWLRRIALAGALTFGAFNLFWTALPFRLSEPDLNWSPAMIGALSLVGVTGIAVATQIGPMFQQGRARVLTVSGILLVMLASAAAGLDFTHVLALVVVAVLLDIGVQSVHTVNQCTVVERGADRRSSVNAVYMSSYFLGGAVGSALAPLVYAVSGWSGTMALGVVAAALALGDWIRTRRRTELW